MTTNPVCLVWSCGESSRYKQKRSNSYRFHNNTLPRVLDVLVKVIHDHRSQRRLAFPIRRNFKHRDFRGAWQSGRPFSEGRTIHPTQLMRSVWSLVRNAGTIQHVPGARGKNLRSGDLAEQLGLFMLQHVAIVVPMPRTEDIGIDAVVTLLRNSDARRFSWTRSK